MLSAEARARPGPRPRRARRPLPPPRRNRALDPARVAGGPSSSASFARGGAGSRSGCSSSARWSRTLIEVGRRLGIGADPLRGRPGRPADHAQRPLPASHEPGRAAAALERPARRDEPRRAAARSRRAGGALQAEADRRRLAVRPGITGWSQIQGRDEITWPERFEHDAWYVENWSLWLDAKILLKTLAQARPAPSRGRWRTR